MSLIEIQESQAALFIGCDEVGYGCLAGPLVVCGVMAPKDWKLDGLNDSKKLSEKKRLLMRDKLNKLIEKEEIWFHLAERSNAFIDKTGVAFALKNAYIECMLELDEYKECLIITDGILKFDNLGVDDYDIVSLIKADQQIPTVMSASILAKTFRDEKMKELHKLHPNYGWDSNVGYGSRDHLEAIAKYGPCTLHRFSYAPMKNMKVEDPRQLTIPGT
jgi:ribonuclease HII